MAQSTTEGELEKAVGGKRTDSERTTQNNTLTNVDPDTTLTNDDGNSLFSPVKYFIKCKSLGNIRQLNNVFFRIKSTSI